MVDDEVLATQLRRWADDSAAPVGADEVLRGRPIELGATRSPQPRADRRRYLLVLAAAAILLVVVVAFAARAGRGDDDGQVATDGSGPRSYRVELDEAGFVNLPAGSRATFVEGVSPRLVTTTRARLYALGRTDAVVSLAEPGSVLVDVDRPLSEREQQLVLGTVGRLELAVLGSPPDPTACDGPMSFGAATRPGSWPGWGPVEACSIPKRRMENPFATLQDDGLIRVGDPLPTVERADDSVVVRIEASHLPLATGSGPNDSSCGDEAACLASVALTIDGTIYDGPSADRTSLPYETSIAVADEEDGRLLVAVLIGGALPGPVIITDLGRDATTTVPSFDSSVVPGTVGSTPDPTDTSDSPVPSEASVVEPEPAPAPATATANLVLDHASIDLDAVEMDQPIAGATIELRQGDRVVPVVTGADGRATATVGVGMWRITASSAICTVEVTVVVLTPGSPFVALSC